MSTELANRKPIGHLERVRELSRACFDPRHACFEKVATRDAILLGLFYWAQNPSQAANWWWTQIGVPQVMRDILALLGPRLNAEQRMAALRVLGYAKANGTGANLLWLADLQLHYACFIGDEQMAGEMSDRIGDEIVISKEEGIQADFSFHQHGARLQQFAYGKSFLQVASRLAWQVRGTPLAFSQTKTGLLCDYLLEGCQWMARRNFTVPGTLDRSVSRKDSLQSADLRDVLRQLINVNPAKAPTLQAVADRQNGRGETLTGHRHFPHSDFTAYHRPGFSFFLKTISNRTLPAECINQENLLGHRMHSGDAYLIADGIEYDNLQPVWDWEQLPGVTAASHMGEWQPAAAVGSVSDGTSGITAMDYHFGDEHHGLTARKIWACHGDVIVCLIANLSVYGQPGNIRTALDQCRLRGRVTAGLADGSTRTIPKGIQALKQVCWLHHGNFAYILLEPASITIKTGEINGGWTSINIGQPDEEVQENIFLPLVEHSSRTDQNSGYVLAYAPSVEKAKALYSHPSWKVLQNDGRCQAVEFLESDPHSVNGKGGFIGGKEFEHGVVMAAFHEPGQFHSSSIGLIQVKEPCLILRNASGQLETKNRDFDRESRI